jgi:hypothetical protein
MTRSPQSSDRYQWIPFWEHWGLVTVLAIFAAMHVLFFFVTLTGVPWICFFAGSLALLFTGGSLLLHAKMPAYRSGRFFSFGISSVPTHLTRFYRWGWRLFLAGMVIAILLLFSRHDPV